MKRIIPKVLPFVLMLCFSGCWNKQPVPLKEIEGDIHTMKVQISIDKTFSTVSIYIDFTLIDDANGKQYKVSLNTPSLLGGYNCLAYLDKLDFFLPDTKIALFEGVDPKTEFAVTPMFSGNNIHIKYIEPYGTNKIENLTGRITPKTVLIIKQEDEKLLPSWNTNVGIQNLVKPYFDRYTHQAIGIQPLLKFSATAWMETDRSYRN